MSEKEHVNETEVEKVEDGQVAVEDGDREDEYEKVCFMCRRPESVAGKMMDLPNNICVCQDCMQKSFDIMSNGQFDYSQLMNIPGMQIFSINDMEKTVPKKQKLKKKKESEGKTPVLDIKDIPAPHKIKAKLDDFVNFIPARVSALLMILASSISGQDGRNAWRIFWRDRYCHASPNSAQTEAVMAGALGVRLAGDAWYFGEKYQKPYIGEETRPVEREDIARSCRLMYDTVYLTAALALALKCGIILLSVA